MKNTTKMTIAFLAGLVLFLLIAMSSMVEYYKIPTKPTIVVKEIDMTPQNFFRQNDDIMMTFESAIYRSYSEKENNKWRTKYKYVYIISYETPEQRSEAARFLRKSYLASHPKDAVDKKLIFSDQMPDLQIFNIQEAVKK